MSTVSPTFNPTITFASVLTDLGHFTWDGENYSHTAENIHFALEGDGDVPVLRASLFDAEGNSETRDINLGERVVNNDGNFIYRK
jgi:hypothetical protein